MALLYGRAGRLTGQHGGFLPGQSVSMRAAAGARLDDVLYVDTRTTVYTAPPAPLADPKKSRIKVASIAGLQCCVPAAKVGLGRTVALYHYSSISYRNR
jgi:hypothetical protein